jgi:hypothetical protein
VNLSFGDEDKKGDEAGIEKAPTYWIFSMLFLIISSKNRLYVFNALISGYKRLKIKIKDREEGVSILFAKYMLL